MQDKFGRQINYLRLSLTERCTLQCAYCRKDEGCCPKEDELSAGDFIAITRAFMNLGINKVRLTGGEPLLRRDLKEIINGIRAIPGLKDLSLTTNAQMLAPIAAELKTAGLDRVNISLDSLRPEVFKRLTGGDLKRTLAGLQAALEHGLTPVRLNVVLLQGVNEAEVEDLLALTKDQPIDVRFIEYMPVGGEADYKGVSNHTLLAAHPQLVELKPRYAFQAAREYQIPGHQGRVGFISAISDCFCADCNRIRVLSDGKVRPCLANDAELDLRPALLEEPEALEKLIREAILSKPARHHFGSQNPEVRSMRRIGG